MESVAQCLTRVVRRAGTTGINHATEASHRGLGTENGLRATLPSVLAAIFGIAYVICTLIYFKSRWAYMERFTSSRPVARPGAAKSN